MRSSIQILMRALGGLGLAVICALLVGGGAMAQETVVGSTSLPPQVLGQAVAQKPGPLLLVDPNQLCPFDVPETISPAEPTPTCPALVTVPMEQLRLPVNGFVRREGFTARLEGVAVNVFRITV